MRALFIALVALVTALTFYSALWFKSVNIEEDITARVTDDMSEAGAKDIAIDVDGRHVTLTGVVFDEAAETSYLGVADNTYGALGPIDGLTYQADGGYVTAIKTAEGITLKGTVPNDDVRATLLTNAQAATDGAVEDQMTVSGPVADWQGEAAFGVTQLAGLTSGAMNAADGTYSLSGIAAENPADITGAVDARDGWQSFVSSPNNFVAAIKDADGITLKGMVGTEDARAALVANAEAATDGAVADELQISGQVADWQDEAAFGVTQLSGLKSGTLNAADGIFSLSGVTDGDPAAVSGALEGRSGWKSFVSSPMKEQALSADVTRLQGDLSRASSEAGANKAQATALRGRLGLMTSEAGANMAQANALRNRLGLLSTERDGVSAELDTLRASLTEDQSDREALRGELNASKENLADAEAMIAQKDQSIADNLGVIEGLNTRITGLEADVANVTEELGTVSDINAELSSVILERNNTIDALRKSANDSESDQIVALNAVIEDRDGMIDGLKGQLGERDGEITRLTGELATRDGSLAKTAAEIAALKALTQSGDATTSTLQAQVADLTAGVAERDQTIVDLNSEVASVKGDVVRLTGELDGRAGALAQSEADMAALKAAMADTEADTSGLQSQVADLNADVAERDQAIAALNTNVADLTAVVAERDAALAAKPAASTVASNLGAEQCAQRAGSVMENSRINFATGTARIDNDSVELLERMTGIALACVNDGLTVEVGGHTDSQGSDENNQTLSEARAAAIVAFMTERGVPTEGLAAVGYGESQPIGDNDTSEGRAQNRRISFDWQAR